MYLSNKARTRAENTLKKMRPDMDKYEIMATLAYLHALANDPETNRFVDAVVNWIANKSIRFPHDHVIARQVFDEARKRNVDVFKYKTLGELIKSDEMKPKEKKNSFDPDKAQTFSNKRTVITESGRELTVYDVENSYDGQREVCKALSAHYAASPWCLSTFTANGEPTQSAKHYWNQYNAKPRKIAFEDGRPVAFNSDSRTDSNIAGGWQEIDGIEGYVTEVYDGTNWVIGVSGAEIDRHVSRLVKDGWIKPGKVNDAYVLTDKALSVLKSSGRDSWWDLNDRSPVDKLDDRISANAPNRIKKTNTRREQISDIALSERIAKRWADGEFVVKDENGHAKIYQKEAVSYAAWKLRVAFEQGDSRVDHLRKFWDSQQKDYYNEDLQNAIINAIRDHIDNELSFNRMTSSYGRYDRANNIIKAAFYEIRDEDVLKAYADEVNDNDYPTPLGVVSPSTREKYDFLDKYLNERNEFTDNIAKIAVDILQIHTKQYRSKEDMEKLFNAVYTGVKNSDLAKFSLVTISEVTDALTSRIYDIPVDQIPNSISR